MFKTQSFLNNHLSIKRQHDIIRTAASSPCGKCGSQLTENSNLFRRLRNQHQSANPDTCFFCPQFSAMENSLSEHAQTDHGLNMEKVPGKEVANPEPIESTTVAIDNRFKTHCLKLPRDEISIGPFNFLVSQQPNKIDFIDAELQKVPNSKVGIFIYFDLLKPQTMTKYSLRYFLSGEKCYSITDEEYLDHVGQLMSKLLVFASCGSGWVIESLKCIEFKTPSSQTLNGFFFLERVLL